MELAVLLKAVPRSESLTFDPVRRAVDRGSAELVTNPFDQRALRVALELRRESDRVSVVSLGPPGAAPLLRDALQLGADRALHLCDPAFAGSDLLATSAALAAALRRLGPGIVVAGGRSTDSDTGLAPAEVAARLGLPVVTEARAVRRLEPGGTFEIVQESEVGRASVRVAPPFVLSVGEKVGRPLRPGEYPPASTDAAEALTTLRPSDLGLESAQLGEFGSPTEVAQVRAVAPHRSGRRLDEGSAEARVQAALELLRPRLAERAAGLGPLPWPAAFEPGRELLTLVSRADGRLARSAAGRLTYLRHALPGFTVTAVVAGPELTPEDRSSLAVAGAARMVRLDPQGRGFDSRDVARAVAGLLDMRSKAPAVLFEASAFGREVAGQLAAARLLGAVGDATGARAEGDGTITWEKPSFGGGNVATIRCRSSPVVVTMPSGLAPAGTGAADVSLEVESTLPFEPVGAVSAREEVVEPLAGPEPEEAEVIVAVGAGIGGPEGIERILPVVKRWGAALVATRRVVDAGWMPVRAQVGLTGRFLSPRLAVLVGVRGAPNHMVGWRRAATVLAINHDPSAPVFGSADVGVVGELEETLERMQEPLASALGR